MSTSQQSDAVADAVGAPLPGQVLQQARELQGITLDEVSSRIKVSVTQLAALEKGDMARLPGLAFARGYVRTYSRFLGLDADALVNDFNALYDGGSQRQVKTINRVKPQAHLGDPMIRISVILFVMIVLGSSVWWWQTQMGGSVSLVGAFSAVSSALDKSEVVNIPEKESVDADNSVAADEPVVRLQEAEPTVQEAEPSVQEAEPEPLTDAEIVRLTREMESEAAIATRSDSTTVAAEEVVSISPNGTESEALDSAVLIIRFSSECWVSIKDMSGKVIFASLMQDGNTLERNLDALPVDLLIGQVGAVVQSEFRGQPLDLAPYSKKGVARLTLE